MVHETLKLAPDPDALFHIVASALVSALPPSAPALHIGATAVAGCLTKGDHDIVVRVGRADFPAAQALLIARLNRNTRHRYAHRLAHEGC